MKMIRQHFGLIGLFALFLFVAPLVSGANDIKTSELDNRQYHYMVLQNGLKVLLISDPLAEKAAANMRVSVGSFDDPIDRAGLAHFLEHMLFLGTKKYPDAGSYQSFINNHGGSHNATTGPQETNYFFDVQTDQLGFALDRFSQFFIAPLFDDYYVSRERLAVDSEFQSGLNDEFRRSADVFREVINPLHPLSRFNVGNLQTLSNEDDNSLQADVITFYKRKYSSHKMALVVLGTQSIGSLEQLVLEKFSDIPKLPEPQSPILKHALPPLFDAKQLPLEILSQSLKQSRIMTMSFPVPSTQNIYTHKPLGYLAKLLGDEGPGSPFSLLKQEGLIESLSAGSHRLSKTEENETANNAETFYISMELTPKGFSERTKIQALIFHYIDYIKKNGLSEWRFKESKALLQLAFQYQENASPLQTVRYLSDNISNYPVDDIIYGPYRLDYYDESIIQSYLAFLTPNNLYVTTTSPDVEGDKRSQYYDVAYKVQSLEVTQNDIPESWMTQVSLPKENRFIPTNTAVFQEDLSLRPFHRLVSPRHIYWAKQDVSFNVPKASIILQLEASENIHSLKRVMLNSLYVDILNDRLNRDIYMALEAGIGFSVNANTHGTRVQFFGYSEKFLPLFSIFRETLSSLIVNEDVFNRVKKEQIRLLQNRSNRTPYRQLYNQLVVNLYQPYWSESQRIKVLNSLTFDDLKNFSQAWQKNIAVEGLFYGNFDQAMLDNWTLEVDNLFPDDATKIPTEIVQKLSHDKSQYKIIPIDHNDTAAILYVQGQEDSVEDKAGMILLRQLMQSDFYNDLRTEQQLGYIVFMGSLRLKNVPGSVFVVQSPSASSDEITQAIYSFTNQFVNHWPETIERQKASVIAQIKENPTNLFRSANKFWRIASHHHGNLRYDDTLIDAVKSYSAEKLLAYYQKTLLNAGQHLWVYSRPVTDASSFDKFVGSDEVYRYK